MNVKKTVLMLTIVTVFSVMVQYIQAPVFASAAGQADSSKSAADGGMQQPINATRAAREEKALQDARRQQLAEREAAVAAKEQELKKLSATLEAQVKALEEGKKRLDESHKALTDAQKKKQDEKVAKMVKLFKTMKGEQAGKMMDSLKEDLALSLLSRMDTKTVAKLAPYISQPRVIKWVTENLQER